MNSALFISNCTFGKHNQKQDQTGLSGFPQRLGCKNWSIPTPAARNQDAPTQPEYLQSYPIKVKGLSTMPRLCPLGRSKAKKLSLQTAFSEATSRFELLYEVLQTSA
jgi:hypothetical protein